MKIPWRARPGAGFVVFVCAVAAAAAFFAWGLRTPRLESFWRLQLELERGERPALSSSELELMQEVLAAHPDIGHGLLADSAGSPAPGLISAADENHVPGDYAYLVRPAGTAQTLRVRLAEQSRNDDPVEVHARVVGSAHSGPVTTERPFQWSLPPAELPQLVEIKVRPKKRAAFVVELLETAP